MGKGVTFDNDLLKLIFQATAIANVADNAGSGPLTNLYVALHTSDPSAGNQNTSEATYSGYARVSTTRNANASTGWTVTGANVTNAGALTFPACNGATNSTITHASIGKNNTGTAGEIYYSGALNNSMLISIGITPSFSAGNLTVTES